MTYHFAPTKTVIITKTDSNKHCGGCGELASYTLLVRTGGGTAAWEDSFLDNLDKVTFCMCHLSGDTLDLPS
jgi:hypothetical protein